MKKTILHTVILSAIVATIICGFHFSTAAQIDYFISSNALLEEATIAVQKQGYSNLEEMKHLYFKTYYRAYMVICVVTAVQLGMILFARHKQLSTIATFMIPFTICGLAGLLGYAMTKDMVFLFGILFSFVQALRTSILKEWQR